MTLSRELSSEQAFTITSIDSTQDGLLGYCVTSTATINVEDQPQVPQTNINSKEFRKIAKYLIKSSQPQLVVHIHGYAVSMSDAEARYKQAFQYAESILGRGLNKSECVFIGYRWPAENPKQDEPLVGPNSNTFLNKIVFAFQALPTLPLGVLISTLVFGIVAIVIKIWNNAYSNLILVSLFIILTSAFLGIGLRKLAQAEGFLPIVPNIVLLVLFSLMIWVTVALTPIAKYPNLFLIPLIVVCMLLLGIVVAFILLRLSTYPRDRFRASNYAVMDLVRFFQHLEHEIIKECKEQKIEHLNWKLEKEVTSEDKIRIKLSFIAHSLGCEVATQTIRILSDVFDPNALTDKPTSEIGHVFSLGRLVLVAPDIPLESILSSRSNFLRSSIFRCEEAYIFSNEADLALRVASTTANYFSFPSKTRFRGYKLGNITADRKIRTSYGIINCTAPNFNQPIPPFNCLEIRASKLERRSLTASDFKVMSDGEHLADFFTYFDCTDYKDTINGEGILSFSLRQSALNLWWDYIALCLAFFFNYPRHIDVHGGYFDGKFSQLLINELAFLGYKKLLLKKLIPLPKLLVAQQFDDLPIDQQNQLLEQLSQDCGEKFIQVILASRIVPNAKTSHL